MDDAGTEAAFRDMLGQMFLTKEQRMGWVEGQEKQSVVSKIVKAPFPWFGGKSRVAPIVWEHFGNVPNYVEPFFGSGAVLLGRPHTPRTETINDKDGFVCNFWRAVQVEPEHVARYADWPVNENDMHARHLWLKRQRHTLTARLEGNPDFFDVKIAGWWVWGMACWIGGGFCGSSGAGPWDIQDGQLVHLGDAGQGVTRKLVHLGDAGRGVTKIQTLASWFSSLAQRLRRVRVCCGEWTRVCGPSVMEKHGITGVFLDPPYSQEAERDMGLYAEEDGKIAHAVREWAIENGENPLLRIAFCGYEGEHLFPASWTVVRWKANGGFSNQRKNQVKNNASRETVWFSPHCLGTQQQRLF